MKKKFFVSYASLRSGDAPVVEHFFIRNEMEIVKDTNEKDSYWNFMDQIATVDYVVMLLNNTFFECDVKFNQNCDESFLKYYMTVIDRQLYNRYLQEMKLPENMRDKKILSQFERYGKMNHRIILKFDDNNALENMNFK